jgi:outer membrane protein OmpA-like peptidoglycan-associated protein
MEGAMRKLATAFSILGVAAAAGACSHLPRTRADLVQSSSPCADTHFSVYFNNGSNRLTRQAAQLVAETGRALKACSITSARVVGLADAAGTAEANLSLSQRRALAVAGALRREGLPAPTFEIDAGGETGALLADGREDPVRRRAEVYLVVRPQ